ncbi:hypothetical protein [Acetobacter pasteurianus]|uniref:Uncharacterized protein n=1 Tax=Acetobacter pasteurianus subsp. pasteurianus TaxID=481145 RepID=A0A1Y0YCK2_ACEPA|nr:hypothetical protein [Acetobacter pasteurianus]ARW48695.1 hypothetical protein S1001342_02396 [Acetobacter pasteurianus subsp. pasteurianus]
MRTREEQLEEMAATISDLASNGLCVSYELIKHWVDQAEERARAECAADTRRLDYLDSGCGGSEWIRS